MTLPIYLAMTAEELHSGPSLPPHRAYMACHYAPYGMGLTDLPDQLADSMLLILNDRIPPAGHDPQVILEQLWRILEKNRPSGILLDLQRPGIELNQAVAETVTANISVPVCVSQLYAQTLSCPVLVDMPPLHKPLSKHLQPWTGRELWLDVNAHACVYRVDKDGCTIKSIPPSDISFPLQDDKLHCHYRIQKETGTVSFTLQRTDEDLLALLAEGNGLGITKAIGLYQELAKHKRLFPT